VRALNGPTVAVAEPELCVGWVGAGARGPWPPASGCERIFRVKRSPEDPAGCHHTFHRHQADAIEVAATGASYVLTTAPDRVKSLAYIVPIVDRVLRERDRDPEVVASAL